MNKTQNRTLSRISVERLKYISPLIKEQSDTNTILIADENLLRTLHGELS